MSELAKSLLETYYSQSSNLADSNHDNGHDNSGNWGPSHNDSHDNNPNG